jgi:hypothetical protein
MSSGTMSETVERLVGGPVVPDAGEPLHRAVRRMRWFRRSFRDHLRAMTAATGTTYRLDDDALARVFVRWLRTVEAQRPRDAAVRRAFFDFAGAAMLREMLRVMPVRATALPGGADRSEPAYFWPEGFACTIFCLNVRAAVLAQEYGEEAGVPRAFSDIRTWWSFLENVRIDSARAIGFYDLLVDNEPDWRFPTMFHGRGTLAKPVPPLPLSG